MLLHLKVRSRSAMTATEKYDCIISREEKIPQPESFR